MLDNSYPNKSLMLIMYCLCPQIVIQVGEEMDGVAMVRCAADVRSADHTGKEGDILYKEILCPLKYLQEV